MIVRIGSLLTATVVILAVLSWVREGDAPHHTQFERKLPLKRSLEPSLRIRRAQHPIAMTSHLGGTMM